MGLPGSLARIMIDSGNLVGDEVSEEFARQANLASEPCQKEIETTAAGGKMQIIGRCYPVTLRIAGIGVPPEGKRSGPPGARDRIGGSSRNLPGVPSGRAATGKPG